MPESVIAGDNSFSGFRRRRSVGASLTPISEVLLRTADDSSTQAVVCRDWRTVVFPTHFARELLCLPSGDGFAISSDQSKRPNKDWQSGFPSPDEGLYHQTAFVKRHVKWFCEAPRSVVIFADEGAASGLNCMPRTSPYWSLVVFG